MIPNTQQMSLCFQSGQIPAHILVRPKSHWSTHQEAFIILVTTLTSIEDEVDIRTREKS